MNNFMKEMTFELTNYCPHTCKFCSSNATRSWHAAVFLPLQKIVNILNGFEHKELDVINISGGEPLAHPLFYKIYNLCKTKAKDVVVYTNLITHRRYNAHAIDGVYLEADITVTPETDKIHVLRRVKQGKEANRPEVKLSRNHVEDCSCNHIVVRPNGKIGTTPCNKWRWTENNES